VAIRADFGPASFASGRAIGSGTIGHPDPSGYLTNASHYGLTREAVAAMAGLASVAMADDVDVLADPQATG